MREMIQVECGLDRLGFRQGCDEFEELLKETTDGSVILLEDINNIELRQKIHKMFLNLYGPNHNWGSSDPPQWWKDKYEAKEEKSNE